MLSFIKNIGVVAFVSLIGTSAHAAVSWNFTGNNPELVSTATNGTYRFGGSEQYSDVTVTAWSAAGHSNIENSNSVFGRNPWGLVVDQDGYPCGNYSGCAGYDEHYIDNSDKQEFVLFDFGDKEFSLEQFQNGATQTIKYGTDGQMHRYDDNYTDMTLMAYTGQGDPTQHMSSMSLADLKNNGWVVSHHINTTAGNNAVNDNLKGVFSSYWIVGAYMSAVGTGGDHICQDIYNGIKLAGISGNYRPSKGDPITVPLPGTLALMSLGLLFASRRRRVS